MPALGWTGLPRSTSRRSQTSRPACQRPKREDPPWHSPKDSGGEQEACYGDAMTTLYLSWRPLDMRWWPVGRLSREGREYVFGYTKGAISAHGAGFHPLAGFPDLNEVYVSSALFPLFANRLPP